MTLLYAVCDACESTIVPITAIEARLDEQAQLHARVTGHNVQVFTDSDPDAPVYTVAGEPALFGVGEQQPSTSPRAR
jgi:hypothetical protein